jgi:hypothetical protein
MVPAEHADYINNASDDAGQWIRDAIAMRIDCDVRNIQHVTLMREEDEVVCIRFSSPHYWW